MKIKVCKPPKLPLPVSEKNYNPAPFAQKFRPSPLFEPVMANLDSWVELIYIKLIFIGYKLNWTLKNMLNLSYFSMLNWIGNCHYLNRSHGFTVDIADSEHQQIHILLPHYWTFHQEKLIWIENVNKERI